MNGAFEGFSPLYFLLLRSCLLLVVVVVVVVVWHATRLYLYAVNFDMPDTVDAYTHRIGRTGRAERSGEAFTLAIRGDGLMVKQIEKTLGTRLERRSLPEFEYGSGFVPEKQFPQTSSSSSRSSLPRSYGARGRRRR